MPKILIVEDSRIIAVHLQITLENEGYEVIGKCTSGEAALTFLEHNNPTLILMDIMLEGKLDGVETADIISKLYHIPVVYITALSDKDTIQRAKVTKPYGFIIKPFEDREIFTVIEMAIYRNEIESQLRESEEKYFSTVKSISDSVIMIDRDFLITYMNPSAQAMTGYTLSESIGKTIQDIMNLTDEHTGEISINPLQCPISVGNVTTMPENLLLISKGGTERPIGDSSLSPLLDHQENFTGFVIIFKDLTEKREHQKLLKQLETQKVASLIEGQEKERARIAKDLHDGLGQILNAIKMNTSVIFKNDDEATTLYYLIDEAIQECIRISENLLPAKLKHFDLATCLRSLCKQMDHHKSTVKIDFKDNGIKLKMQQTQKINLYRITQEALNNAVKHAKASNITVQLIEMDDCIRLSIEDDGRGVVTENILNLSTGNGLINMQDRAEIMQGKLSIQSNSSQGTSIVVEIPILNNPDYVQI